MLESEIRDFMATQVGMFIHNFAVKKSTFDRADNKFCVAVFFIFLLRWIEVTAVFETTLEDYCF